MCRHGPHKLSRWWTTAVYLTSCWLWSLATDWLKLTVEQGLKDLFLQKWQSELNSKTSWDIYVELKQENYLLCENHNYKWAICNFRVYKTIIPKVTGIHNMVERNQRFCHLCNDWWWGRLWTSSRACEEIGALHQPAHIQTMCECVCEWENVMQNVCTFF